MGNKWTKDQQNAISAREGTLLVSAAAGSGKTSVLVQRVIERITDQTHPCDADRLLVVTFTKAAAAEMKQRISDSISALLEKNPFDVRLQHQKLLLEKARISTIHSFCADLLRENFFRLGISPGFRIASEDEMTLLREQAVQEAMEELYAAAAESPGAEGLAELMGSDRDDRKLSQTVLQLYDFIRSTAFPERWLGEKLAMYRMEQPLAVSPWGRVLLEYARELLEYALSALRTAEDICEEDPDVKEAFQEALSADSAGLKKCLVLAEQGDWDGLKDALELFSPAKRKNLKKGVGEEIKKEADAVRDSVKELLKELKRYFSMTSAQAGEEIRSQFDIVSALHHVVLRFWELLDERKKEKNVLDYGDLEHFTLELLVVPEEAGYRRTAQARELSEQFEEVMIDEYQDLLAAAMPADRLLRYIYEKKNLPAIVRAMEGGELRVPNLRLLVEYAQTYEAAGYHGLSGFVRYLDRLQEQRADLAAASSGAENANVVRIMSIHHSKGLEFPVVFLAGCSIQFNKKDLYSGLLVHPVFGIGMKRQDEQTLAKFRTAAYDAVQLASERGELSERLRVLYVALTRAKEKLYMVGTVKKLESKITSLTIQLEEGREAVPPFAVLQGKSFTDWLLLAAMRHPNGGALRAFLRGRHLETLPAMPWEILICRPEEGAEEKEKKERILRVPPTEEMMEEIEQRLSYRYPYALLSRVPTKSGASSLAEKETQEEYAALSRPAFLSSHGMTPAERGIALHTFLQFADYTRAGENLQNEIDRMVNQGFLTGEEGRAIDQKRLGAFFHSPLAGRIFRALEGKKLYREVRFIMEVPARELDSSIPEDWEESVVIQGVADCVLIENERIVIIDYKTDRVKEEGELIERYARQLELYARAMERYFQLPVTEHILYSFYLSREISIPVDGMKIKPD